MTTADRQARAVIERWPAMPAEKYTAIYEDLKEKIEEGIYAPQSILPSENIMTMRYGVSRNTIF